MAASDILKEKTVYIAIMNVVVWEEMTLFTPQIGSEICSLLSPIIPYFCGFLFGWLLLCNAGLRQIKPSGQACRASAGVRIWGESVLPALCSGQGTAGAVLVPLPLTLGTSSIAGRHFSSLPPVCPGNVGTLQCLVSARMISQPLQAGNWIAFPMVARVYLKWQLRAQLYCGAAVGAGQGGQQQHSPRRWEVMVFAVSQIVSN